MLGLRFHCEDFDFAKRAARVFSFAAMISLTIPRSFIRSISADRAAIVAAGGDDPNPVGPETVRMRPRSLLCGSGGPSAALFPTSTGDPGPASLDFGIGFRRTRGPVVTAAV